MKRHVLRFLLGIVLGLSFVLPVAGQVSSVPPENATRPVVELGAGLGGYYGTFGGKVSVGGNRWSVDLGLGLGPLADGAVVDISPGMSVYFADRTKALRPKVSLFFSSIGHTINVSDRIVGGSSDVLYQEHFPGLGFLAGVDWGRGQKRRICLDIGLGYVYPFKGYAAVKRIMDDQVRFWRSSGHDIEDRLGLDTVTPLDYVSLSLGVSIAWGRSLASN